MQVREGVSIWAEWAVLLGTSSLPLPLQDSLLCTSPEQDGGKFSVAKQKNKNKMQSQKKKKAVLFNFWGVAVPCSSHHVLQKLEELHNLPG